MSSPDTNAIVLSAPIEAASLPSIHPVLAFYAKYDVAMQDPANNSASAWYSRDANLKLPMMATFRGRDQVWSYYTRLFSPPQTIELEIIYSVTLVSSPADGKHRLTMEYVRGLRNRDGIMVTRVPQVWAYDIGVADQGEGEGTDGYQIHGVRCYYDMCLMNRAVRPRDDDADEPGEVIIESTEV
jgi:hypothetical protein